MKQFNKGKIALINKGIAEFMGWEKESRVSELTDRHLYDVLVSPDKSDVLRIDEELYRLEYNSSWDALMPVIIKIATEIRFRTRFHLSGFPINVSICGSGGVHIAINQGNCAGEEYKGERIIADTMNLNYCINDEKMQYKPIELAWIAIAQFIEWYKKNKDAVTI
jgi:hypothetical protein